MKASFGFTLVSASFALMTSFSGFGQECHLLMMTPDENGGFYRRSPPFSQDLFQAKGYATYEDNNEKFQTPDANILLKWQGYEVPTAEGVKVVISGAYAPVKLDQNGDAEVLLDGIEFKGESFDPFVTWPAPKSAEEAAKQVEEEQDRSRKSMEAAVKDAIAKMPTCEELWSRVPKK